MSLLVGIAEIEFTPELGLPLQGNYRDDYACRGVHDGLFSKALAFGDEDGNRVILIALDLCEVERHHIAIVRSAVERGTGLPESRILVSSLHVHSGPATADSGSGPVSPPEAIQRFLTVAAEAGIRAFSNMRPMNIHIGRSYEKRVSFNRRLLCKDGVTHMNWEKLDPAFVVKPRGEIDPELIYLSFQEGGKILATMVNFALHPAILAGDNWLYSADYPGYMAEALRRLFSKDHINAFFNGCCGNINHIDYSDPFQGRGFKMCQEIGYTLAVTAWEAKKSAQPLMGNTVGVSREMVRLKRTKVSEEQKSWSLKVLAESEKNPSAGLVDGLPDEFYARAFLDLYEKQYADDEAEVMVIRIGELAVVGLPGEMFTEFGVDIKRRSKARHTIVIGLANDCIGYLPTRISFSEGGYEPSPGCTKYEEGAGEELVESALRQIERLFQV